jgi:hypothetical protein
LAAAENGILGSTVGMQPGTASAYLAGTAPAAAAAAPAAATTAATGTAPAAAAPAAAAGASALPRLADGSLDWAKIATNPALLAAATGAVAAVAGNDDMSVGTTSQQTQNVSSATTGNATGNTNQNSATGLAPWLAPYAQDAVARAQTLANSSTTNAPMDAARTGLTSIATGGTPITNSAQQQQMDLIGGKYLNSNPYIDQVAANVGQRMGDAYATGTRAGTFSNFNNDGNSVFSKSAFGQTLGMNDRAFGDALGSTMNNLYFGNYQNERAAQDAASRGSLQFGQFDVNNLQNLYTMGSQDWMRPLLQQQTYNSSINPAYGQTNNTNSATTQNTWTGNNTATNTTGTQQQNIAAPNDWMAAAGGGLLATGLYRSIFGGK